MSERQSRIWVFTRQFTQQEMVQWVQTVTWEDNLHIHEDTRVKYCVYQVEQAPTTGQMHYQGFLELNQPRRMTAVKNIIGGNPHVEVCKHKVQSINYCKKSETRQAGPWEHGDPGKLPVDGEKPVGRMTQLWEEVKKGRKMRELLEQDPKIACWDRQVKTMRFALQEMESDRQVKGIKVWALWGKTGTGKTFTAINTFCTDGDYYILEPPGKRGEKLWYDGYEGQHTLIMDDFKDTFCSLESLKRILDKYKFKVEVKGGFAWAVWDRVIITSNYQPSHWYKTWDGGVRDDLEPLERRINEIREVVAQGVWRKCNFNNTEVEDEVPITSEFMVLAPPTPQTLDPVQVTPPLVPIPLDDDIGIPSVPSTLPPGGYIIPTPVGNPYQLTPEESIPPSQDYDDALRDYENEHGMWRDLSPFVDKNDFL